MGIVCLTQANKEKPWILFESGALAKGLKSSRVCTFLIDLDSTDVANPLAQFNHTLPTREGVLHLVSTLNAGLGDASLSDKILEQVFDTYWPQFEKKFKAIASKVQEEAPVAERSDEEVMVEVLRTVRSMDRRMRDLESERAIQRKSAVNHPSNASLRQMIEVMIRDGMPPDLVMDRFRGEMPVGLLRALINETMNEPEDESQGG